MKAGIIFRMKAEGWDHFPFVIGHFSLVIWLAVEGSIKANTWARMTNENCQMTNGK
jgi:hypothetical protein